MIYSLKAKISNSPPITKKKTIKKVSAPTGLRENLSVVISPVNSPIKLRLSHI